MRYHCVQCDQEFDVEDAQGGDKPRCPKCLRQHGLRPVEATAARPRARSGLTGVVTVFVLMLAAGGGYYFWTRSSSEAGTAGPAVDADSLRTAVGTDVGNAGDLFRADDAIEKLAAKATDGKGSDVAKVEAVVAAIQERAKKQAFVPSSLNEPREAPAMIASEAFAAMAKDGARTELYPLEVVAVAVAALRSVDVPAQVFEVHTFGRDRSPLDPSGRLGYFAVGLAPEKPGGSAHVFDVFGGRPKSATAPDAAAISDAQAAGALLALRAIHQVAHANDPGTGLRLADAAVKLAPSSAAVRGVRAAVLLSTGGKDEGARELEAAGQLRAGAAQQNNLAMYSLATGEVDRAAKLVAAALSAMPDYAAGHLTLASVHLARTEKDLARAELEQAERLEPRLPALPMAWAELYAGSGDFMQARVKAEEAVRARPKSAEAHLLLARVHRQAGNYDAMRKEARVVIELAPSAQKEQISQVLRAVLGPTALEDDSAEPGDPSAAAPSEDGADSTLEAPRDPGSLQLGAGEPKLRLGGDSKLKLDLTH